MAVEFPAKATAIFRPATVEVERHGRALVCLWKASTYWRTPRTLEARNRQQCPPTASLHQCVNRSLPMRLFVNTCHIASALRTTPAPSNVRPPCHAYWFSACSLLLASVAAMHSRNHGPFASTARYQKKKHHNHHHHNHHQQHHQHQAMTNIPALQPSNRCQVCLSEGYRTRTP